MKHLKWLILAIILVIFSTSCSKSSTGPVDISLPPPIAPIVMIFVPSGTFQRDANISNTCFVSAFYMSEKEITRSQFVDITGLPDPSNVATSTGVHDPVQMVNWYHALVFCNKLSIREGLTPVYTIKGSTDPADWGAVPNSIDDDCSVWDEVIVNWTATGYRLPTEMEWMWAAMGAVDQLTGYGKAFAGSTGSNFIDDYVWYISNSNETTHPVGTKLPNELGLYDMSGNVWEWCSDWIGDYPSGPISDYKGEVSGSRRVTRGGCRSTLTPNLFVASRESLYPLFRLDIIGFRVVRH